MHVRHVNTYSEARVARLRSLECAYLSDSEKIRKSLRMIRTSLWFEYVRTKLELPAASGIQRCLAKKLSENASRRAEAAVPSSSLLKDDESKIWPKYARALHSPSRSSLDSVDMVLPGSSLIFSTRAWQCFDMCMPAIGKVDWLLSGLGAPVQVVLFEEKLLELGIVKRRVKPLSQIANALAGIGTLDSLGALVVLLREAHEEGRGKDSLTIGRAIHMGLILLVQNYPFRLVSKEIYWFHCRYVLPMADNGKARLDLSEARLEYQALLLERLVPDFEDDGLLDHQTAYGPALISIIMENEILRTFLCHRYRIAPTSSRREKLCVLVEDSNRKFDHALNIACEAFNVFGQTLAIIGMDNVISSKTR